MSLSLPERRRVLAAARGLPIVSAPERVEDFIGRILGLNPVQKTVVDLQMPTPPRKKIASVVETKLLTLSRRRCCVCASLENDTGVKTDGQIAHVDRNRTNNELDNLVYLCLRHHDMYDTVRRQSKGITANELKHYRSELYRSLGTDRPGLPDASLVEESQIQLGERIKRDCADLGVPERTLINFILEEAGQLHIFFK